MLRLWQATEGGREEKRRRERGGEGGGALQCSYMYTNHVRERMREKGRKERRGREKER